MQRIPIVVAAVLTSAWAAAAAPAGEENPFERPLLVGAPVAHWDFEDGVQGWAAVHECLLAAGDGHLLVRTLGGDPYLHGPRVDLPGPVLVRMRLRAEGAGGGQLFWTTRAEPHWSEPKSVRFDLVHDGEARDVELFVEAPGSITQLRLDPGMAPGTVALDSFEILSAQRHPLEIESLEVAEGGVSLTVRNHGGESRTVRLGGEEVVVEAGGNAVLEGPAPGQRRFTMVKLALESPGLPAVRRTVGVFRLGLEDPEALSCRAGDLVVRAARDGSGAVIERQGRAVAVVAPLVHREGVQPPLRGRMREDSLLEYAGEGITVRIAVQGEEIFFAISAGERVEGPVVRVLGELEQGLFAGLEYLGRGEASSSALDVETDDRFRYVPDPRKVTLPLMACVTDRGLVALSWDDMALQPVFATPNVFDGAADHRMALRGREVAAVLRVGEGDLDDAILWAVRRRGLPPLPDLPRDPDAQAALSLAALEGPLRDGSGWGHCVEPRWPRQPYASFASTIFRLTGELPTLPGPLTEGGSHIPNDAVWFLTGAADEWLARRQALVQGILARQRDDGLFGYDGPYRRGHFEDTASGYSGHLAGLLLEHAWLTGDAECREAGLRTLRAMRRFTVPRGAQTWELSLHTPDVLAAGRLVHAYVRGFQLTADRTLLEDARGWALRGIPFVYLWGDRPTMTYATVPVYGATNWRAPLWIGLPVQWCGVVYARALVDLAPLDSTLPWDHLAEGILIAAERMQRTEPQYLGCFPDAFRLDDQAPLPPHINPCSLVSLRLALEGRVDSLAVAVDEHHRVVAPFPVTLENGRAHVRAIEGLDYQLLVDGTRILDVHSTGHDLIDLATR